MNNSDMPAMPCQASVNRETDEIQPYQFGNNDFVVMGLTKREEFAKAAMQGCWWELTDCGKNFHMEMAAKCCVEMADALLKKLEETK